MFYSVPGKPRYYLIQIIQSSTVYTANHNRENKEMSKCRLHLQILHTSI